MLKNFYPRKRCVFGRMTLMLKKPRNKWDGMACYSKRGGQNQTKVQNGNIRKYNVILILQRLLSFSRSRG